MSHAIIASIYEEKLIAWKEEILQGNRETITGMQENVAPIPDLVDRASSEADRALRKGRRLLDALDRLQLAMLGEGPSQRHLALLQGALSEQRDATGDIGLDDTLNWAEVRVAVEAAKLEREAEPA